ncbi:sulfatase [Paenibacillus sp. IB182496]|uniref:Sulfatase n=1 Tax=Paenibacillus sabuli TaxID=2772509 RepID=A0A927BYK7_9BACL|nr:sulfatase [Paenibacillus sabuli]MBD2847794.1 sulfatase [Paenibacillus sabuli]
MNIVYLHSHDTGRYIQPYGYPVPTPHLMKLAEEGVLFRQAYCAAPTCSPSRAALLTGMSPHSCGMLGLTHRGFSLTNPERHLASYLRENGFKTVLCGIQHEAAQPAELGYTDILPGTSTTDDRRNAGLAAAYIKDYRADQPFFLSFGMFNTHRDFPDADPDIRADYVMPPAMLYDHPDNREDTARYMTSARIMDDSVGIVLEALEQAGLASDTLILYTTDHGIAFPHMKSQLYDNGIGVSLIMKHPQTFQRQGAVDALVSHLDVFPTLCELLELDQPDWLQGVSLLPLLTGEAGQVREEVCAEVTYHAAYEPMRCIRTPRYKYIRLYEDHGRHVAANIDDGLSKSFMMEHGFLDETREQEMLFDLYLDPVERVNLAGRPSYAAIQQELQTRLTDWMKQTGDPLLDGPVEKPAGARINKLDTLSPREQDYE